MNPRNTDVEIALKRFAKDGGLLNSEERPMWSRIGWMTEVKEWIKDSVEKIGCAGEAKITQLQYQFTGAVLQIEIGPVKLYFKASTMKGFDSETARTAGLARHFPEDIVRVLCRDEGRRWMLLEDAGPAVGTFSDVMRGCSFATLKRVLGTWGKIQKASVNNFDELVSSGFTPRDRQWYVKHFATMWEDSLVTAALEESGEAVKGTAESWHRAHLTSVHKTWDTLSASKIPLCLAHGDLEVVNVGTGADGMSLNFFDFKEAQLTNPFLDFIRFSKLDRLKPPHEVSKFDFYLDIWSDYGTGGELLKLLPTVKKLSKMESLLWMYGRVLCADPEHLAYEMWHFGRKISNTIDGLDL